jgi:putative transcriptional regulator
MYHYTESGLQNVWLRNGYRRVRTAYGEALSIHDVPGLHRVIGRALARRTHLTGGGLRFLRKELGLSQKGLAQMVGTSEQNVSLWERRGRIPVAADRLVRLVYLDAIDGNVQVRAIMGQLLALDAADAERIELAEGVKGWREAA